eukprot:8522811-Pyramimonas_sp.AAC.1
MHNALDGRVHLKEAFDAGTNADDCGGENEKASIRRGSGRQGGLLPEEEQHLLHVPVQSRERHKEHSLSGQDAIRWFSVQSNATRCAGSIHPPVRREGIYSGWGPVR